MGRGGGNRGGRLGAQGAQEGDAFLGDKQSVHLVWKRVIKIE